MLKRIEPLLKLACAILAAVLIWEVGRIFAENKSVDFKIPTAMTVRAEAPATNSPTNKSPQKAIAANNIPVAPQSRAPGAQPGADIPASVQRKVDRIYESELLGQVIRPMPLALLGIGGKDAFIRAPNGQSGLLREGEELGGVKLLKIGTNRVLVEEQGKKKELMIFSGLGSQTLVEKEQAK